MKKLVTSFVVTALAVAGCGGGNHHSSTTSSSTTSQHEYITPYGPSAHPPGWGLPPKGQSFPPNSHTQSALPSVQMFDTITLSSLNGLHPLVLAGYTSGRWPTYNSLKTQYPKAKVISINISSIFHGYCLDIEPGDAVPSQAPGWYRADKAAGFDKPCLYSSYWEFKNQVIPTMSNAGIPPTAYFKWDADYTFVNHIDTGFDATQWTDKAYNRNLDESTDTLTFAGLTPTPKPKPANVVCFGPNSTPKAKACVAVVARVNGYRRAVTSSRRALVTTQHILATNHCKQPYRRSVCVRNGKNQRTFQRRISYYNHLIIKTTGGK